MRCSSDDCPRPDEDTPTAPLTSHWFAGYGFYNEYHPECCPRSEDGTDCELEHP